MHANLTCVWPLSLRWLGGWWTDFLCGWFSDFHFFSVVGLWHGQVIDASSRKFPDLCQCSTEVEEEEDGEEECLLTLPNPPISPYLRYPLYVLHCIAIILCMRYFYHSKFLRLANLRSLSGMTDRASTARGSEKEGDRCSTWGSSDSWSRGFPLDTLRLSLWFSYAFFMLFLCLFSSLVHRS